jgi:hypothetical protein
MPEFYEAACDAIFAAGFVRRQFRRKVQPARRAAKKTFSEVKVSITLLYRTFK